MPIDESSEARRNRLYIACGATSCWQEWNVRSRVFSFAQFLSKNAFKTLFKRGLANWLAQNRVQNRWGEKALILACLKSPTNEFD